jgi:predicted transcriptional regulator
MLQVMAEKGLVRRDETQRAHAYFASRSAESTQRDLVSDLLQRAFGGSVKKLVLGALSSSRSSREELAEIRRLLESYEKEKL